MFLVVKVLFSAISAWLVWQTVRQNCNKYLAFVVAAVWLRFSQHYLRTAGGWLFN